VQICTDHRELKCEMDEIKRNNYNLEVSIRQLKNKNDELQIKCNNYEETSNDLSEKKISMEKENTV
jgi:uncharacterized protein YlxW (UPF0749 family)